MSSDAIAGTTSSPVLKISGLSGVKTEEIVSGLMSVERRPVTRLEEQAAVGEHEQAALHTVQGSLSELAARARDLASSSLFVSTQTAASSEPARVAATATDGAAVGGYEVNVIGLASAAQRSYNFSTPESAQTLTVNGREIQLTAGEKLSEVAEAINADSETGLYAAASGSDVLALSSRLTGTVGNVELSDSGSALSERSGSARVGRDAELEINGELTTSESNTVTEAIPGVTLTLGALTTAGPVTVTVAPPSLDSEKITETIKAFVTQYNAVISRLQGELSTKPESGLQAQAEKGTGSLFGDPELEGILSQIREQVYTAVAGLGSPTSSLAAIGISTDEPGQTGTPSQAAVEGKLTIDEATLQAALGSEPEASRRVLEGFSNRLEQTLEAFAGPTGTLESRMQNDEAQTRYFGERIAALNEALAVRQRSLETEYVALETVIQRAHSQSSWLTSAIDKLNGTSSSSSESSGL
jgi:flagellar hook-associated protein 2